MCISYKLRCAARAALLPEKSRSILSESETMTRHVRKYVCGIVHMPVSAIIVTIDL